jgi:hypothetical protein
MKYKYSDIKQSVIEFLGEDGYNFFRNLKEERGRVWCCVKTEDGIPWHSWTNPGRQIRNHVIEKFPGIVDQLGDYGDFEAYIYSLVEDIFE